MKHTGLVRLGRDADLRDANGTPVANLALAYNYGKKENGEQPTQWVQASLWGKRAEALAQYLTKGTAIVVTLSDLHVRMYEKDGQQRAALNARVDDVEFVGKQGDGQPTQRQQPSPQPQPEPQLQGGGAGGFSDDLDDDIPFKSIHWLAI